MEPELVPLKAKPVASWTAMFKHNFPDEIKFIAMVSDDYYFNGEQKLLVHDFDSILAHLAKAIARR